MSFAVSQSTCSCEIRIAFSVVMRLSFDASFCAVTSPRYRTRKLNLNTESGSVKLNHIVTPLMNSIQSVEKAQEQVVLVITVRDLWCERVLVFDLERGK